MAETVEALIGATFHVNGLESCKPIVNSLVKFATEKQEKLRAYGVFDKSQNYKGKLLELFKNPRLNKSGEELKTSDLKPSLKECPDGSHTFQFEGELVFNGDKYEISTHRWLKRKEAEQEAAFIALCQICGDEPKYGEFDPVSNTQAPKDKKVHSSRSIDSEELIFCNLDLSETIKVSQKNNELLIDWIKKKKKKNYFRMLFLLSARLDTVSIASWTCEVSSDVLAIINLQIKDQKYFTFGYGESKTQAFKTAGENMQMKVDIFKWINEHYPDNVI